MAEILKHIDIHNPLTGTVDSRDIGADGANIVIPYDNKDMVIKTTEASNVEYTKALVDALRDYAPVVSLTQQEYDSLPTYKEYDDKIYIIDGEYEGIKAQNVRYDNSQTKIKAGTVQSAIDLLVQYILTGGVIGGGGGASIHPARLELDGSEKTEGINVDASANIFLLYTVDRNIDTDSTILIPGVKETATLKGDNGISNRVEVSYESGTMTVKDNGNQCMFYFVSIAATGGSGGGGGSALGGMTMEVKNHTLIFTKSTNPLVIGV